MPSDDRDQQFESALARHLRSSSPDAACPDTETLAAYHECTLTSEEMTLWKEHIRACSRCQESLALVEQSDAVVKEKRERLGIPAYGIAAPASEMGRSFRTVRAEGENLETPDTSASLLPVKEMKRSAAWRWLVPAGALAASLLVWIGWHEKKIAQAPNSANLQVAENREARPENPTMKYSEPLGKGDELSSSRRASSAQAGDRPAGAADQGLLPAGSQLPAPANAPNPVPGKAISGSAADQQRILDELSAAKQKAPQQANASSEETAKDLQSAGGKETASAPEPVPPQKSMKAGDAVGALAMNQLTRAESKKFEPTERPGATIFLARDAASRDSHLIIAPGNKKVWRLGAAGKIEYSSDAGQSWTRQPSGVTVDLSAGSAPSDQVCWIVGKAGTLLLTTDEGKHWQQITPPFTDDLGGVRATDAQHASIWDVSARQRFATRDGGVTWTRDASE
jgi:hypothetical protein